MVAINFHAILDVIADDMGVVAQAAKMAIGNPTIAIARSNSSAQSGNVVDGINTLAVSRATRATTT